MQVDARDVDILKAIADAETKSPDTIHERTGIPLSTIHYRLDKLKDAGIIVNDLYDVDLEKLGLETTFVIEVIAEYGEDFHAEVGEDILDIEGVTQVFFTAGEMDFIVVTQVADREMVEDVISEFEEIDGVDRTKSMYTIKTLRQGHSPLQHYDRDTLVEKLTDSSVE
jgi:DNA-binding Lrp family transcriptional regulator